MNDDPFDDLSLLPPLPLDAHAVATAHNKNIHDPTLPAAAKHSQNRIRSIVALETAQMFLSLGILKKEDVFKSYVFQQLNHHQFSTSPSPSSSASLPSSSSSSSEQETVSEKEKGVLAALETALEVFYELRNDRQAAATHYQLGSFYSNYWPLCLTEQGQRSDALLEKALLHYREAHGYYSKYDVGPTLILILVDMCDLYLAAFMAQECFLKGKGKGNSNDSASENGKIYLSSFLSRSFIHLLTVSIPSSSQKNVIKHHQSSLGSVAANDDNTDALDNDLISALLGGALQSLLDSRFAFTPAVAIRSRYRDQIGALLVIECVLQTPFQRSLCEHPFNIAFNTPL